jgi:UDP-N-acetylmuramoyl-tripeptide--D-alanyl-D-alanine ligase
MVGNAMAAVAVGIALGLTGAECAAGLKEVQLSPWRMEMFETAGGIRVLNDAYNANPASMAAALKAVRWMSQGARSIAVLGEMAELGELAAAEHEHVGELVARLGIDHLIVVGDRAAAIAIGAEREGVEPERIFRAGTVEEAVRQVKVIAREGDVVLLKASRVGGLERIAERLR